MNEDNLVIFDENERPMTIEDYRGMILTTIKRGDELQVERDALRKQLDKRTEQRDNLGLLCINTRKERDALRKQLEIAVEALEYYDQKEDYQIGTVAYRALTIIRPAKNNEALAEIEKMNNQLV
jgi:hypothetical protein